MTPTEYFVEIAVPTLLEFKAERRCRRRAYLACIAVFHLKDHLKKAGQHDVENTLRNEVGAKFDVVQSVCNASKHLEAHRKSDGQLMLVAGADWDRPPARAGVMKAGVSRLGDRTGGREVIFDGNRTDIYDCARSVLYGFWKSYPTHFSTCNVTGI